MVYVDTLKMPYRRMLMSHMLADSIDELHAMADAIGVKRRWFQNKGTPHYDVCQSMRAKAVELGAVEIDRRKTVELVRAWRDRQQRTR
jgi:hypothetical protein